MGCGGVPDDPAAARPDVAGKADGFGGASLGATLDRTAGVAAFRMYSAHATRVELWIHDAPYGANAVAREQLTRDDATGQWSIELDLADLEAMTDGTIYYGYRVWGPNWPFDPAWEPGSAAGGRRGTGTGRPAGRGHLRARRPQPVGAHRALTPRDSLAEKPLAPKDCRS